MSKRSTPATTPSTMPGSASSVQTSRSLTRNSVRETGSVRIQSRLPSVRACDCICGVITRPTVMSVTVGAPVAR